MNVRKVRPEPTYDILGLTSLELSAIESALRVATSRWPDHAQLQAPGQGVLRAVEKVIGT